MTAADKNRSDASATRGTRLSRAQVLAIAECIAAGERHVAIAERFGVSVETIGAIKSGKRWSTAIDAELRSRMIDAPAARILDAADARRVMAALEAGRSGRSIAAEFGISSSTVSAIRNGRAWSALDPGLPARLSGWPRRGKALGASQVAEIKQRLLAGQSSRKVAAQFGVSASTVLAIARGKTWTEVAPRGSEVDVSAS
jgi:DNA-binding CsgD family transcriptional regulator